MIKEEGRIDEVSARGTPLDRGNNSGVLNRNVNHDY